MSNLDTNLVCTCNPFGLRRSPHAAILIWTGPQTWQKTYQTAMNDPLRLHWWSKTANEYITHWFTSYWKYRQKPSLLCMSAIEIYKQETKDLRSSCLSMFSLLEAIEMSLLQDVINVRVIRFYLNFFIALFLGEPRDIESQGSSAPGEGVL